MQTLIIDEDYIRERNKLIPEAEQFANKSYGVSAKGKSEPEREEWTARWNLAFHNKMNRLWRLREVS